MDAHLRELFRKKTTRERITYDRIHQMLSDVHEQISDEPATRMTMLSMAHGLNPCIVGCMQRANVLKLAGNRWYWIGKKSKRVVERDVLRVYKKYTETMSKYANNQRSYRRNKD